MEIILFQVIHYLAFADTADKINHCHRIWEVVGVPDKHWLVIKIL